MQLRKNTVAEEPFTSFNTKLFNTGYLVKNQPVKVSGMANNWNATKLWDFDYLSEKSGSSTSMVSIFYHKP